MLRTEEGLSVAEVLLAASVLLLGFLGFGRVTAAAVAAQGRAADRDRALAAAYDVGDLLQVDGCILLTGAEVAADGDAVVSRCRATLGLTTALGAGNGTYDDGAHAYAFTYSSRWLAADAPADGFGCASPVYATRPTAVERTLDVRYRERTTARSRAHTTRIESLPPDGYERRSLQRSNLVVRAGDAHAVGELAGPASPPVRRAADPNGCIWFPFLRTGTYRVTTTATGGTSTRVVDLVADPRAAAALQVDP